ncbi:MAG: hypothetical protein II278_00060 [Bacteroidaceae bacterium]|nr:hypothetical protein [Bacteroidaceae bacterium]
MRGEPFSEQALPGIVKRMRGMGIKNLRDIVLQAQFSLDMNPRKLCLVLITQQQLNLQRKSQRSKSQRKLYQRKLYQQRLNQLQQCQLQEQRCHKIRMIQML